MMKAHTVTSVVRTEAGGGLALLHMGHSWCPQCFMNPACPEHLEACAVFVKYDISSTEFIYIISHLWGAAPSP